MVEYFSANSQTNFTGDACSFELEPRLKKTYSADKTNPEYYNKEL
jgi:hypothetical protein